MEKGKDSVLVLSRRKGMGGELRKLSVEGEKKKKKDLLEGSPSGRT